MSQSTKYCCAQIIPSGCVPYTGKKLKFLADADQPDCDASINEVLDKVSIAIDELKKATDVSAHTAGCLTLPATKTAKTLLQAHADKICALAAAVTALQTQLAALDISDDLISIDLGCLKTQASNCEIGTNKYKLINLLTLFKNEICAIKTHLGI
jgi:hypothetical protein